MRAGSLMLLSAASGVAALIYEIVWFQLLELVVGSTAVALGVLLTMFMGGMCLGSLLFPRLVSTRRDPLKVYATMEAGIGALGIVVLLLVPMAGSVHTFWSGHGVLGFLLRGAVAAVCLLPPTLLMGATLPALARTIKAAPSDVSRVGVLYAANIAGAVFGCLLSGFYLLRVYDTSTATYVGAGINFAIAALAGALAGTKASRQEQPEITGDDRSTATGNRSVYIAIAFSGLCALGAETIWTRILGLLFGASVYTFSVILAVFLTGLGMGSGLGSLFLKTVIRPRLALGWCQLLAAGAMTWAAYTMTASLPYWPINPSISSNIWFNFELDLARALWAILPATVLWGASFPLALGAIATGGQDVAASVSKIYSANTLGAIVGAIGSSVLLVAWIGSQRTEQVLIGLSAIVGLFLVLPAARVRWPVAALGLLLTGLCIQTVPLMERVLIAHGRFAASWVGKSDIIYAKEGMNASVAVSKFASGALTFHVAGKIQASDVPRDLRLQRMLGHLTTLTVEHPRSVLVIGCGAGVTAGAVSIDPQVERETIVEIEALVPEAAAKFFHKTNFDVLATPKVQVLIDDGRHFLLTTKEQFDAITIDPLDPWAKGAASLYTKEFLEVIKQHLNTGGTVTMYIQLFENTEEAVKSTLATFFDVFPNGTIWGNPYQGKGHDMVLLGQVEPLRIDLDGLERRVDYRGDSLMSQSLTEVGMNSPVDLFATYAGRKGDLSEWLAGAAINQDRNLRMQYLAGMGLNEDDSVAIYGGMLAYRRFPEDLFVSAEGRVNSLRDAIRRGP
ncbi:MAG: fused MFS/spermidine synthase [Acidobacteriota bacterium]